MCLGAKLRELFDAGFAGIWVQSQEPDEAIAELRQLANNEHYKIHGIRDDGTLSTEPGPEFNPFEVFQSFAGTASEVPTILLLPNFHSYIGDPVIKQLLFRTIQSGKRSQRYVVIISPTVSIPIELERVIRIVEHSLPDRDKLAEIAHGIATEPGEMPDGTDLDRLLDAASGLTEGEAEGAFSLSVVRHGKIDPASVWDLKAEALKKNGTLQLHLGNEQIDDLAGLEVVKEVVIQSIRPGRKIHPKGCLLLSPPGCGKSQLCKALGNATGRRVIRFDPGSVMGSLVGQTEQQMRAALNQIDAMAPAILWVDELEKALAGAGTENTGVTTRMVGSLLSWLQDHTSDIYVVCTSNDISKLPPELTRAGRFDAVFFIDLPTSEQREAIWGIHQRKYGIPEQPRPDSENWTGAEIESCCRLAALMDIPLTEAALYVVPIAVTAADRVEGLRQWASGRVLDADRKGIYHRTRQNAEPARRTIKRKTDLE